MANAQQKEDDGVCVEDKARVRSKIIHNGIVKQIKCSRQRNGR